MINLIGIELFKIFRKWRTYIGFIVIAVIVALIQMAVFFDSDRNNNFMPYSLSQSFIMVGNMVNGYFISYFILYSIALHIPFLITLVSGDLLAGEATSGTYRLLVTRPVSRFQIVTSKFLASVIYTASLVFWLGLVSLGLGLILLGTGQVMIFQNGMIVILEQGDAFLRLIYAYSYAALAMCVISTLALFFSSLVENAIGPIISTMAVVLVLTILGELPFEIFKSMKPYFFTTYISSWREFFSDPIEYGEVLKNISILLGHVVGLYAITYYIFRKKDILS